MNWRLTHRDENPGGGKLSEALLFGQIRVLKLLARGAEVEQVLGELCHAFESTFPGVSCCVMTLGRDDDRLALGAAPSLPPDLRQALQRVPLGPSQGSCAAAALRREVVVAADIDDPVWGELRAAALASGVRASWSTPMRPLGRQARPASGAPILGTIAFYFEAARTPTIDDLLMLEMASALASLAIHAVQSGDFETEALRDTVTGLPGRRAFVDQLKEALTLVGPEAKLALVLLDLDRFKEVNDSLGYAVGDLVLRGVAHRLGAVAGAEDLAARLGDDEFGLLVLDPERAGAVRELSEQVLREVARPFEFGGPEIEITASVGVALHPWDGQDDQTLLRNAEAAVAEAKREGRNTLRMYAPSIGRDAFERLRLKGALGHAAENGELEIRYQPQVAAGDGRTVACEALLYWNHPGEGLLRPASFIPLAEETGLILPIGEWVLDRVCADAQEWRQRGFSEVRAAVNISALQFHQPEFAERVAAVLERSGLEPEALELELTETLAMTEVHETLARMTALERLGVRLAIDDFGTGYSSLAYLGRFPICTLKVDRSFVNRLPEDKETRAIVKAVLALARNLDLEVVAEGVETERQAEFLRERGCDVLQGFLYSRPVPREALLRYLGERGDAASGRSAG